MRRYVFHFWNREKFGEETVVIVGSHHADAQVAAWTVLGSLMLDQHPRKSWRLVSSVDQPLSTWMQQENQREQEVSS